MWAWPKTKEGEKTPPSKGRENKAGNRQKKGKGKKGKKGGNNYQPMHKGGVGQEGIKMKLGM